MRRGRYTNVRIWSFSDLGTCRKEDLFVTNGSATEIVEIDNLKQQYMNDEDKVWEINKQIQILNHQANSNIPDNKKEIIEKNIEEVKARAEENKKNEPFWGLLS